MFVGDDSIGFCESGVVSSDTFLEFVCMVFGMRYFYEFARLECFGIEIVS